MSGNVESGTRVRLTFVSPFGNAAAERKQHEGAIVTLLEDARIGADGGWDVYDVRLDNGTETFAHGFELFPLACDFQPYGEAACGLPATDRGVIEGKTIAIVCEHHANVLASDHREAEWEPLARDHGGES